MATVSEQTIIWLVITCVLLAILPFIPWIIWKKKCKDKANFKPLLIGVIGFLVTVRVLELIPHIFCIILVNPVSQFINGHTWAYVLYGITMAGVFEECGRYVIMRYLWKKKQTKENVIMYGIGHGGIEVWAISLMAIGSYLVMAYFVKTLGLEGAYAQLGITGSNAEATTALVQSTIIPYGALSTLYSICERLAAMTLHISLSVVVYYSLKKEKKGYLLLAVVAHAVFDLFPALSQKNAVSMTACQVWIYVWAVLAAVYAYRLYHELEE